MPDNGLLAQTCREILLENGRPGGFTVPTAQLYPFQWLWDSGFIALGLAHFDLPAAMREIETLHSAQWANGFVPHIVFHSPDEIDKYFPGPDVHGAASSIYAPKHVATTGLTQPPVIGWVLEHIFRTAGNDPRMLPFIEQQFDHIYRFHEYLYQCRDPRQEGLVYIQHNWESGTDNSPVWDEIWKTFEAPTYVLPRRDIQHVNADQRPTQRDYEYYIYLLEIFRSVAYRDADIAARSPFLVQDPLFNTMLAASNESLARLGSLIGAAPGKIEQLTHWYQQTCKAMNDKLWDEASGAYLHYDLRNERPIQAVTSSSLSPLFAGIPSPAQAAQLTQLLEQAFAGPDKDLFLCPSFDPRDPRFNPVKYWRGPVWINMNWIISHGLQRYGAHAQASRLREDAIRLVKRYGCWEYFNPQPAAAEAAGHGYGADRFSWTAALVLDWLMTDSTAGAS